MTVSMTEGPAGFDSERKRRAKLRVQWEEESVAPPAAARAQCMAVLPSRTTICNHELRLEPSLRLLGSGSDFECGTEYALSRLPYMDPNC